MNILTIHQEVILIPRSSRITLTGFLALLGTTLVVSACSTPDGETTLHKITNQQQENPLLDDSIEQMTPEIISTYRISPSFVQGLELDDKGHLLIGTGEYGSSEIKKINYQEFKTIAKQQLPPEVFGEGTTSTESATWQLTWKEGIAYKRDKNTLKELSTAHYEGEGWGLCYLKEQDSLVMSDGTDELRLLNKDTFQEKSRVKVTAAGKPVDKLNELECVDNKVYANIFTTRDIVGISMKNNENTDMEKGQVVEHIDASSLLNRNDTSPENVLNGIAHIPGISNKFFLTGKNWPDLYEVRFVNTFT